jgi:hypothetical protein
MANWTHRLELKDLWEEFDNGTKTVDAIAKEVSTRLKALKLPEDFEGDQYDIIERLDESDINEQEFNDIMNRLYDLGDCALPTPMGQMTRKLIWINTAF